MQRFGMMAKVIAVVLGVTLAIAALASASAQQEPPHRFYGTDATPGDEIAAVVPHGDHYDTVGADTVNADGSWYIDVDRDMADDIEFTVNGAHAEAEITPRGSGQSQVTLTVAMVEDSMDDDSMMEDDDSMMEDDDSMMDDDDSMMDDDDSMEDDEMLATAPPTTGTGGLADNGGISAGLIGLLIALGGAAVAGIGVRRVRNRA